MTTLMQTAHYAAAPKPKGVFSALRWLSHALTIRRERQALSEMSTARLEDIGLTRDQALEEAGKPIWDVPTHWCR